MFEKIKAFLKKHKIYVLIVCLVLLIAIPVLIIIFSEEEEVEKDDRGPFEFDRGDRAGATYENYDINFSENVIGKIDNYSGEYLVYEILDVDHTAWVEEFANAVRSDLEYREQSHPAVVGHDVHTLDQSLHYWELEDEVIHYDVARDIMFFKFEDAVAIPNIDIDPESKQSVENALRQLNEEYFSEDFVISVNDITEDDDYYRVEYSRYLDEVPVNVLNNPLYLILNSEGEVKEGRFSLAEFEEIGGVTTLEGVALQGAMTAGDFDKNISFTLSDTSMFGGLNEAYFLLSLTGDERGEIDLNDVSFSYEYTSKFLETMYPRFTLEGVGFVEIDGEELEAEFEVRTDSSL